MNRRYQVFVSSTYEDLKEERFQVLKALLELDCIPCGMEYFPAASEDQWTYIRELIAECDYYLVIIAGRYGSTDEDGVGYTEKEYDFAVAQGIPTVAFIHRDPSSRPARQVEATEEGREKLRAFTAKVQRKLCKHWNTPGELEAVVSRGITQLIRRKPRPGWVRADAISDVPAEIETLRDQLRRLVTVVDHLRGVYPGPDASGVVPSALFTPPELDAAPSADRETAEPATAPSPPLAELSDDDLAFLEELDRAIMATPAVDRSASAKQVETKLASAALQPPNERVGLTVLDELDRVIHASGPEKNPEEPRASSEPVQAPTQHVVCAECGALNEPGSRYCEVCWEELAQVQPESAPAAVPSAPSTLLELEPAPSADSETTEPASTPSPLLAGLSDEDLAFIEELDRAINASGPEKDPEAPGASSEPAQAPTEHVLCVECGALNESGSRYCKICGDELAQLEPESAPAAAVSAPAPEPAPAPAATLVPAERLLCKECGEINEPHSWYCEICGSEL